MADSEVNPRMENSKKSKKRKQRLPGKTERPSKLQCTESAEKEDEIKEVEDGESSEMRHANEEELELGPPWTNLQLILSIQNKQLDTQRKIELAFNFVQSSSKEGDGIDQDYETVKLPRLLHFLNDWIQSLLISSDKRSRVDGKKPQAEGIEANFDFRCWEIFKFCLEESLKLHVSLSISRNLLRPLCYIAGNALKLLDDCSVYSEEALVASERFKLYDTVLDCVSLVFSSHGGLSNENLDLWVSTVGAVVELVQKMYTKNLDSSNIGVFALRYLCLVLEPFAKFLRIHPTKKSGFHEFVDKLLEPLLLLLGELHLRTNVSDPIWTCESLKLVEEVLSQGLFHPIHIDGFLSLHISEKFVALHDEKSKDSKTVVKSYHRHLFDELEKILGKKKVMVVGSTGFLFRLLVDQVKKLKGTSLLPEERRMVEKSVESTHDSSSSIRKKFPESGGVLPGKSYYSINLSADTRKSVFDFFVQIMEPLLLEVNAYIDAKVEDRPPLLAVHDTFKAISNLLACFMHEKVYVRTEDTSGGACLNFLQKVYDVIMSLSTKLRCLSEYDTNNRMQKTVTSLANEILIAIGYLLEIEYEVIGDDLVKLWLMMFSYLAIDLAFTDVQHECSLSFTIPKLGCQIINLYSQLRQVKTAIFALCKAIRLIVSYKGDDKRSSSRFFASLCHEAYSESVERLLSSQKFVHKFHKAVKSIPEGQVSGCVWLLKEDITESLKWLKESPQLVDGEEFPNHVFNLQVELLGRGLSKLYALMLDSLMVTEGNSNLLGVAMKGLMALLSPCMSSLVGLHPDAISKFLSSVLGKPYDNKVAGKQNGSKKLGMSIQWVFVFFFQLFMSCRSLFRQAISLMPPDLSKKMSAEMGDSFTAYAAWDMIERVDGIDGGYFSWIIQPSTSLLVVIQLVSDMYHQDETIDSCHLIYIFHAMALQRLVDLNRQIVLLKYFQGDHNQSRIQAVKEEAAGLTNFMMDHLSLVYQHPISISKASCGDPSDQALRESDECDIGFTVSSRKSLPTSIWASLCRNIDIWGNHAAKKQLNKFFSLLLHTSLCCVSGSSPAIRENKNNENGQLNKVTLQQISLELLGNSVLFEQRFVRRKFPSRFCRVFEKSVLTLFSDFSRGDANIRSSPNWDEVLSALESSSMVFHGNNNVTYDDPRVAEPLAHPSDKMPTYIGKDEKPPPLSSVQFTICHRLLDFLCWMPDINTRSLSCYVTCILNLERLVVGAILNFQGILYRDHYYELLMLFVSCRKALRYLVMAVCETTEIDGSLLNSIFLGCTYPVQWLLKSVSVIVGLQEEWSKSVTTQIGNMMFSLMDHTSYVFLGIGKYQLLNAENPCKEQSSSRIAPGESLFLQADQILDSSKCLGAWQCVSFVSENLKEQMQSLRVSLKDVSCHRKVGFGIADENLNRLSASVSCFSGFLCGLASAMNLTDAKHSDQKAKALRWKGEHGSELNVLSEFIDFFVHMLLVENNQPAIRLCEARSRQKSGCGTGLFDAKYRAPNYSVAEIDNPFDTEYQKSEAEMTSSTSLAIDDDSKSTNARKKRSRTAASILNMSDSFVPQCVNKIFLQSLLKGNHPEAAFLLSQLFIAYSAILRLNLQSNGNPSLSSFMPIFIEISRVLLLEFTDMAEVPQQSSFVLLDGVVCFLNELASHFSFADPTSSRKMYTQLIELHLRAIGKSITLQGKRATLASHETRSSTKTFHMGLFKAYPPSESYCLDEFKARVRMSFKAYIKKPSELHLFSVVQAIERALVGVQEKFSMIYDIETSADGGKISSIVAAGIDCLDLVLEFVSGRKGLSLIKRHIQSLVAGIFNIILHLQSRQIFYRELKSSSGKLVKDPDPGSVILMCIEVLTRVSGKHALYKMDAWHLGHCLHIPGALFQTFHLLRISEASVQSNSSTISRDQVSGPVATMHICHVDCQFSIDLFAACCQLLCTVVKHHNSECKQCIALLEASVSVLLNCLEAVANESMVRNGYFSWKIEEGVKCACFLRRVYEEIRQQKDVFGQHCSLFLSNYIWIYSGHGPQRSGIRREIDEALRPGIYALIDACSADDLQYIHTVFGEGPCRNTLAALQHDYKLNFKYEGKV